MSLKIGIVGLPNVGKSTLFHALTKKKVEIENYPFCTIDSNIGIVKVPDKRLDKLAEIYQPKKVLPTIIEFVDIAGIVKGASKGEGLGNKFLSHIREVDAIIEVVRHFEDKNIAHVAGGIQPENDKEIIDTELALADLETIEKRLKKLKIQIKSSTDKITFQTIEILEKLQASLSDAKPARLLNFTDDENKIVKGFNLLTIKPLLYVNNIDEKEIGIVPETDKSINICAKLESDLSVLSENEIKEYLEQVEIKQTGLDKLIKASYKLLGLITFLTTQSKECKAWTIKKGTKAQQAGGVIHGDFEKGFIRVEVISWNDFLKCESEQDAREQGFLKTEGKDYIIKDGDICHFLFNV